MTGWRLSVPGYGVKVPLARHDVSWGLAPAGYGSLPAGAQGAVISPTMACAPPGSGGILSGRGALLFRARRRPCDHVERLWVNLPPRAATRPGGKWARDRAGISSRPGGRLRVRLLTARQSLP